MLQIDLSRMQTDVVFLYEEGCEGSDNMLDTFAYFPNNPHSKGNDLMSCFSLGEGHSACHVEYAKKCTPAVVEHYHHLLQYLHVKYGNLNILNTN